MITVFLLFNSIDILCSERARATQSSAVIVTGGMAAGTIIGYAAVLVTNPAEGISAGGAFAAAAVGVMGTLGRFLRGVALPVVGSTVVSSTAQISALVTAAGGVILLSDGFHWYALILALIAAASSAYAVLAADKTAEKISDGSVVRR